LTVRYTKRVPVLSQKDDEYDTVIKILSSKGDDYANEQEIRYIRKCNAGYNPIKIKEVVYGLKSEENGNEMEMVRSRVSHRFPEYIMSRSDIPRYSLEKRNIDT
jgi:hypothetical protein